MENRTVPFSLESGLILGGHGFKEKIKELIDRIKANDELPQVRRLKETLSIEKIITVCCSFYGKTLNLTLVDYMLAEFL